MSESIKLKKPFEFEGETITEITLSELRGRQFMAAIKEMSSIQAERGVTDEPSAIEMASFLMAKSAGLPFEAVEEMHIEDFVPLAGRFVPLVASLAGTSAGS